MTTYPFWSPDSASVGLIVLSLSGRRHRSIDESLEHHPLTSRPTTLSTMIQCVTRTSAIRRGAGIVSIVASTRASLIMTHWKLLSSSVKKSPVTSRGPHWLSGPRGVRFVDDYAARFHHPTHLGDRDLDIGERIAIDRDDIGDIAG